MNHSTDFEQVTPRVGEVIVHKLEFDRQGKVKRQILMQRPKSVKIQRTIMQYMGNTEL